MKISKKLSRLITDATFDLEFMSDYGYHFEYPTFNQIVKNENLVSRILLNLWFDYQFDIEMKFSSGEDYSYLIPVYVEICKVLEVEPKY